VRDNIRRLFSLDDVVALVTGSSGGIGLALARGLAEAGARVVVNGRDPDRVAAAVAALKDEGLSADAAVFDVTDPQGVERGVASIEQEIGPIHVLVNNAGIQRRAPLEDFPPETWGELMRTNLDAVFYVGQAVAKRMIPRGKGQIINIASVQSELARTNIAPYTASKGAVEGNGRWRSHRAFSKRPFEARFPPFRDIRDLNRVGLLSTLSRLRSSAVRTGWKHEKSVLSRRGLAPRGVRFQAQ